MGFSSLLIHYWFMTLLALASNTATIFGHGWPIFVVIITLPLTNSSLHIHTAQPVEQLHEDSWHFSTIQPPGFLRAVRNFTTVGMTVIWLALVYWFEIIFCMLMLLLLLLLLLLMLLRLLLLLLPISDAFKKPVFVHRYQCNMLPRSRSWLVKQMKVQINFLWGVCLY